MKKLALTFLLGFALGVVAAMWFQSDSRKDAKGAKEFPHLAVLAPLRASPSASCGVDHAALAQSSAAIGWMMKARGASLPATVEFAGRVMNQTNVVIPLP